MRETKTPSYLARHTYPKYSKARTKRKQQKKPEVVKCLRYAQTGIQAASSAHTKQAGRVELEVLKGRTNHQSKNLYPAKFSIKSEIN